MSVRPHFFDSADIRVNDKRVVCVVDDKAWLSAAGLFHMFLFNVVDLDFIVSAAL